jgi:hypothetical protein
MNGMLFYTTTIIPLNTFTLVTLTTANPPCSVSTGETEARQYVYHPILSIVSEFEYPKILYLCCLTFLREYTCIVFGKWDKYSVLSQMTDPTKKVFDTQDIWPYWRKNKHNFFSFVNPNPRQWIFSQTKEILIPVSGSEIKTILYDTNTFLISFAPLV